MKFNKKILIIIIIIILAIGGIAIPAITPNTAVNNIVEDNNIEIVQQVDTQTNENALEDVVIVSKEKEQEQEVGQSEEEKSSESFRGHVHRTRQRYDLRYQAEPAGGGIFHTVPEISGGCGSGHADQAVCQEGQTPEED